MATNPIERQASVRASTPSSRDVRTSPLAVWSALLSVYLIWGSTYLAIRYAVETTPPFLMAAARFLISGGFLFALRRLAGDPVPTAAEWRAATIVGVFLLVGGNGGVVWAEQFVPSALAALLVATVPLWMALIDVFARGHRPNPIEASGIVVGFGGVVLLIGWPAAYADGMNSYGAAALVLASLSWAVGSLYGRHARLPASQLLGTGMEMLAGGIALFALSLVAGEWNEFEAAAVSARSALALAYLTVVGSSAFVAYVWLLRVAPTPLVSTYAYVNPLVAVFLGYFLAGEPVTSRILLATIVIIGSVVLVTAPKR
jgi:drug/metabolite transporter (DMT)-like permease